MIRTLPATTTIVRHRPSVASLQVVGSCSHFSTSRIGRKSHAGTDGDELFSFKKDNFGQTPSPHSPLLNVSEWLKRDPPELTRRERSRNHANSKGTTSRASENEGLSAMSTGSNEGIANMECSSSTVVPGGSSQFQEVSGKVVHLAEVTQKEKLGPQSMPYKFALGSLKMRTPAPRYSSATPSQDTQWLQATHAFLNARSLLMNISPPRPADYLAAINLASASHAALATLFHLAEKDYGVSGNNIPTHTYQQLEAEAKKEHHQKRSHEILERLVQRERSNQLLLLQATKTTHLGKIAVTMQRIESAWTPFLRRRGLDALREGQAEELMEIFSQRQEERAKHRDEREPNDELTTDDSVVEDRSPSTSFTPYMGSVGNHLSQEMRTSMEDFMGKCGEIFRLRHQGHWRDAVALYHVAMGEARNALPSLPRAEKEILRSHMRHQTSMLFNNMIRLTNWETALECVTLTLQEKVRRIGAVSSQSWIMGLHLLAARRSMKPLSTTRLSPPSLLIPLFRSLSNRVPHAWRVALHSVQDAVLASNTFTSWSSSRMAADIATGQSSSLANEQHALQYILLASLFQADLNKRFVSSQTSFESGRILAMAKRIPEGQWSSIIPPLVNFQLYKNTFSGYLQLLGFFPTPFKIPLERRSVVQFSRMCQEQKRGICVVDTNMVDRVLSNASTISSQLVQEAHGEIQSVQFVIPYPVLLEFARGVRNAPTSGSGSKQQKRHMVQKNNSVSLLYRHTRPRAAAQQQEAVSSVTVFLMEKELPCMSLNALNALHGCGNMWVIDRYINTVALSCQLGYLQGQQRVSSTSDFTHFHLREALGRHAPEVQRGFVWVATRDAELRSHAQRCGLGVYPALEVVEEEEEEDVELDDSETTTLDVVTTAEVAVIEEDPRDG